MSDKIKTILEDDRTIEYIEWDRENGECFSTHGEYGVDEIRPYAENGPSGEVPWLAVFRGGAIVARVPAHQVSISYGKE